MAKLMNLWRNPISIEIKSRERLFATRTNICNNPTIFVSFIHNHYFCAKLLLIMKSIVTFVLFSVLASVVCHASISHQIEKANSFVDTNPDSALILCDSLLDIVDSDIKSKAQLLSIRGNALFSIGKNKDAITAFQNAVNAASEARDSLTLANALSDMGVVYRVSEHPDTALLFYNKALDIFNKIDAPAETAHLLTSIAILFTNQGRIKEAIPYAQRAFKTATESDNIETEMYSGATLGIILFHDGQTDEGLDIERKMVHIAETKGAPRYILKTYASIIDMHYKLGDTDSVAVYINRGKDLLPQVPENSVEAIGFLEESYIVLTSLKRYSESLEIQQHLLSLRGVNNFAPIDKLYQRMARNYRGIGDIDRMGDAYERSIAISDSLHGLEIDQQLSDFNVKYETTEKELEIARLETEKANERQKFIVWLSLTALVIIIGTILTFTHLKAIRRKNELAKMRAQLDGIEQERERLAKELHDGVCNDLVGLRMMLECKTAKPDEISDIVNRMRADVRSISHDLMPPSLNKATLDQLLADYALRYKDTVSFHCNIPTGLSCKVIPNNTSHEIYRIIQEWIGNIRNHTNATTISIHLTLTTQDLSIKVTDNGVAIADSGYESHGIGLTTIAQRIATINATMTKTAHNGLNTMNIFISKP